MILSLSLSLSLSLLGFHCHDSIGPYQLSFDSSRGCVDSSLSSCRWIGDNPERVGIKERRDPGEGTRPQRTNKFYYRRRCRRWRQRRRRRRRRRRRCRCRLLASLASLYGRLRETLPTPVAAATTPSIAMASRRQPNTKQMAHEIHSISIRLF